MHWTIEEAAELGEQLFCTYLDFENAYNLN
jgi:hypothetical protein